MGKYEKLTKVCLPKPVTVYIGTWMITTKSVGICLANLSEDVNPLFFFYTVISLNTQDAEDIKIESQ